MPGARRIPRDEAVSLPTIVSVPLSYRDAEPILRALGGPEAPNDWQGGLPFRYHVGPGPASVRVRVPVGAPQKAVAVPVSALRKGPQGDQVFIITQDKDGRARAHVQQVESGAMFGDEVVIYTGLTAGDRVAASGSFKLREAALVSIADAGSGEPQRRQSVSLH